jgi:uncharacterized Zn-finger protein
MLFPRFFNVGKINVSNLSKPLQCRKIKKEQDHPTVFSFSGFANFVERNTIIDRNLSNFEVDIVENIYFPLEF